MPTSALPLVFAGSVGSFSSNVGLPVILIAVVVLIVIAVAFFIRRRR